MSQLGKFIFCYHFDSWSNGLPFLHRNPGQMVTTMLIKKSVMVRGHSSVTSCSGRWEGVSFPGKNVTKV